MKHFISRASEGLSTHAMIMMFCAGMRDVDDLLSLCSYCQLRINPYMFNYCLSVAILHRYVKIRKCNRLYFLLSKLDTEPKVTWYITVSDLTRRD